MRPEILTGVPTEAGIEITVSDFSVFGLMAAAKAGTGYCTVILTNTAGGQDTARASGGRAVSRQGDRTSR